MKAPSHDTGEDFEVDHYGKVHVLQPAANDEPYKVIYPSKGGEGCVSERVLLDVNHPNTHEHACSSQRP